MVVYTVVGLKPHKEPSLQATVVVLLRPFTWIAHRIARIWRDIMPTVNGTKTK